MDPKTQYTAFLIPAFETGRRAGLGADSNIDSLVGSWDEPIAAASDAPIRNFPFYHQWRFGTAALGDFESLARQLQPRELDENSGHRLVNITNAGMGLNNAQQAENFPNPVYPDNDGTINMEGALKPAGATYTDAEHAKLNGAVYCRSQEGIKLANRFAKFSAHLQTQTVSLTLMFLVILIMIP